MESTPESPAGRSYLVVSVKVTGNAQEPLKSSRGTATVLRPL